MAELPLALRTYLDHLLVERGLATNTLTSYRRDLRRYLQFLAGAGVDDLDKLRMSFWRYNNRVHGLASSRLRTWGSSAAVPPATTRRG